MIYKWAFIGDTPALVQIFSDGAHDLELVMDQNMLITFKTLFENLKHSWTQ